MKKAEFKWGKLSRRQAMVLTWWQSAEYGDYNGIIADGSIRSGKTTAMAFSFVVWAMTKFAGQNFALCGKTIESLRRNVIKQLKAQLIQRNFDIQEKKSENLLIIKKNGVTNSFYLFGGRDERSQDLIQGITLAGLFCDEVALMPESFVNQATARCSVEGSKFWFNCNPAGPFHWFYTGWIKRCKARRLVYIHFTMDDNFTLSEPIKERYKAQYIGVFYSRYILGLWVAAEGLIYDMFNRNRHVVDAIPVREGETYVSCDFGIQNATVFLYWQKESGTNKWICAKEWYYSGRDNQRQKTVTELVEGLKSICSVMPKQVIIDPSASALITELRRCGFHVLPARNEVMPGIADVSTMLHQDRLKFSSSCANTLEEFEVYAWDKKAADRGEDKPIKEHDHAMDAIRYFVRTKHLVSKESSGRYISPLTGY